MKTFLVKFEGGQGAEVQAESARAAREAAEEAYDLRVVSVVELDDDETLEAGDDGGE